MRRQAENAPCSGSDAGIRNCPAVAEPLLASASAQIRNLFQLVWATQQDDGPAVEKTLGQPQTTSLAIWSVNATPESSAGQGFDKAFIDSEATLARFEWCALRFAAFGLRRLQPTEVGSNEARKIRIFKAEAGGE